MLREGERSLRVTIFQLGYQSPPAFRLGLGLELTPWALVLLSLSWLGWSEAAGSPGPPAFPLKILGHNHEPIYCNKPLSIRKVDRIYVSFFAGERRAQWRPL